MSREINLFRSAKTDIVMVRDIKTGETLPLEDLVKSYSNDEIIVVSKELKVESEGVIIVNGTKLPYVEGYEYVTGNEVESRLRNGEELQFLNEDLHLKLIEDEGVSKLCFNSHEGQYIELGYSMEDVKSDFWLVKVE
ncbi:hypothetical protein P9X10_02560 [Bacillus cereus]|nr:hypothetical protein [Bacillus cereus]